MAKKATLRVIYRANRLTNLFVVSSRGNSASLKICERSLCRKKHVLRRVWKSASFPPSSWTEVISSFLHYICLLFRLLTTFADSSCKTVPVPTVYSWAFRQLSDLLDRPRKKRGGYFFADRRPSTYFTTQKSSFSQIYYCSFPVIACHFCCSWIFLVLLCIWTCEDYKKWRVGFFSKTLASMENI